MAGHWDGTFLPQRYRTPVWGDPDFHNDPPTPPPTDCRYCGRVRIEHHDLRPWGGGGLYQAYCDGRLVIRRDWSDSPGPVLPPPWCSRRSGR